ncbi:MAG: flagellar hook capping protein [Eubacterium sp.]|nr:flagellar hook capping protein [Eubacterium sp.]
MAGVELASVVPVNKDGTVAENPKKTESTESTGSTLGKDEFLQLLVAQMKYQNPLEPMDNTEYVSQLAQFSQLEEMQNIQSTVHNLKGTQLLGKQVIIHTKNSSGAVNEIVGYVDYTTTQGNKTYLSVNGSLYSIDDLYTVLDDDYINAASIASSFSSLMKSLPSADDLTLESEETLKNIRAAYESLSAYQKSFISQEDLKKLEELEAKMEQLKAAAGDQKPEDNGDAS